MKKFSAAHFLLAFCMKFSLLFFFLSGQKACHHPSLKMNEETVERIKKQRQEQPKKGLEDTQIMNH
jgi:hypothetical protein